MIHEKKTTPLYVLCRLLVFPVAIVLINSLPSAGSPQQNITIAGLVVDAETMQGIAGAQVYGNNNSTPVVTDQKGYYKIELPYNNTKLKFRLRIETPGYETLTDNEHWGDFSNKDIQATYGKSIFYFGLRKKHINISDFSTHESSIAEATGLDYEHVLSGFAAVKDQQIAIRKQHMFENRLDSVKTDNQLVLIRMDGNYYVTDDGGYVRIDSENDRVSVDGKVIKAGELNLSLKRKDIRGMSTADASLPYKVYIWTKKNRKGYRKEFK